MTKYAILCSGQGAINSDQFQLAKGCKESLAIIEMFSAHFGWDMFLVEKEGSLDLRLNKFSQPLTIAASLANWEALKVLLPPPAFVAGYSAGEVSAWGCSGFLDISSVVHFSKLRCESMEKFTPSDSGMLAVKGLKKDALLKQFDDRQLYIAIINEADHFIVGGLNVDLEWLEGKLIAAGVWFKRLTVSIPSHTPLLSDAAYELRGSLGNIRCVDKVPKIPILQGVNGLIAPNFEAGMNSLVNAVFSPINWQACMQSLEDLGIRVVLELGPGSGLSKMISEIHPSISARSVSEFRTSEGVEKWLSRELEG